MLFLCLCLLSKQVHGVHGMHMHLGLDWAWASFTICIHTQKTTRIALPGVVREFGQLAAFTFQAPCASAGRKIEDPNGQVS